MARRRRRGRAAQDPGGSSRRQRDASPALYAKACSNSSAESSVLAAMRLAWRLGRLSLSAAAWPST